MWRELEAALIVWFGVRPGLLAPDLQARVEGPGEVFEAVDKFGAVAVDPSDAIGDAVDAGVVLGARERGSVNFDADDDVPMAGLRKGDGVAACAGKEVDNDARGVVMLFIFTGELGSDFTGGVLTQ